MWPAQLASPMSSITKNSCPPLMNDPQQSELVLRLAENLFGPERVHQLTQPSMVAEDFAYFLEQAPGCMIFLGIGEPERANALHTDTFTFDEEVLFQGSSSWSVWSSPKAENRDSLARSARSLLN